MQEVSELRRSLDDAEVLGRDTRKEWAVLRSQNLGLKERDVSVQHGCANAKRRHARVGLGS